jgi:DNA polymerase
MGDKTLHIDIETYSSIDITKAGVYRYVESIDFEILLISYAYGDRDIKLIDLTKGDIIPTDFWLALFDKSIKKYAHNAAFERICFNKHFGIKLPIDQWYCTAVLASSCGLPLSLAKVSSALELGDHGKLSTGRALIKKFCMPQKRNLIRVLPEDAPEDWKRFCEYCIQDVEAERRIHLLIGHYEQCSIEREMYILDQIINDRGVLVDINFAKSATLLHKGHKEEILNELKEITGLVNPNSPAQLKAWLSKSMGIPITTLDKNKIGPLVEQAGAGLAGEVLKLRSMASKTSIQKYISMVRSACEDQRIRGMFQFLGAGRTGRWAGRIVQAHNLPRNYIEPLDFWRSLVFNRDIDTIKMFTNDVSLILSQLIRTAFIAPTGKTFGVADFSAIEARVIAWVSGEQWRLKVFNTHGKIYEASAASMFNVPIESITKGSPLRDRGKVAELALGFQGGHKAIARMGGSNRLRDEEYCRGLA